MPGEIERVVLSFLPQAVEVPHVPHQFLRNHHLIRRLGRHLVEDVLNFGNAGAEAPI